MTFTKGLREGIRRGEITCSVRFWVRPRVPVGARYRMEEGEIQVDSIQPIGLPDTLCPMMVSSIGGSSGFHPVEGTGAQFRMASVITPGVFPENAWWPVAIS
jgi:hypothetical protein